MPKPVRLDGPLPVELAVALAVGAVLSLAVCVSILPIGGDGDPAPSPPPTLVLPAAAVADTALAPGAALARPPFTPGRRPPARPPATDATGKSQADLRLTGIIAGPGGTGVAMAIDQRTQQPVTLRAGTRFNDWMVDMVGRDNVTLRRGAESQRLTLPLASQAVTGSVP